MAKKLGKVSKDGTAPELLMIGPVDRVVCFQVKVRPLENNTSTTKRNITTTRNTIITIPILLVILNHQVIQIERSIIITKKILKKEMLIKKR